MRAGGLVSATWWDAQGADFNRTMLARGVNDPRTDLTRPWVAEHVGDASVLDVGCGTGELAALLLDRPNAGAYAGVDFSDVMVEVCRGRFLRDRAQFWCVDASELPLADDTFDFSVARHVLEHLEDWRPTVAELRRVAHTAIVVCYLPIGSDVDLVHERSGAEVLERAVDCGIYDAMDTSVDRAGRRVA